MLSITNLKGFLKQAQIPSSSVFFTVYTKVCRRSTSSQPSLHISLHWGSQPFFFFLNIYSFKDRLQYHRSQKKNSFGFQKPGGRLLRDQYQLFFWQMLFTPQGWVYVLVFLTSSMKQHYFPPLISISWAQLLVPSPISKHKKPVTLLLRGWFLKLLATELEAWGSTL